MILAMPRILFISVLFVPFVAWQALSSPPIPTKAEAKRIPGQTVGIPSCSARSCHGGDEPLPDRLIGRHEYSAWNYADPHTRSLQVLHNNLSKRICKQLHLKPAYEEPRCLACHAETVGGDGPVHLSAVGCESCHGPAWLWLEPHTKKDWREKYADAAKTLLNINDLTAVARSCVGCHIGSPPVDGIGLRDMNHDMIAAGHPRLNFEFAGYLAQLPSHWNDTARPRDAQFYAKAWTVGQAVGAEASLNLLEYRATNGVWPELAEYACYACHHDLAGPSPANWRKDSKGTMPWGSWYFAALPAVAPESREPMRRFAEFLSQRPAGPKVAEEIKVIRPLVDGVVKGIGQPVNSAELRSRVGRGLVDPAQRDWDGAAQLYLAMSALSPDANSAKLAEFWKELRDPRTFSAKRDQYLKQLDDLLKNAGAAPP